MPRRTDPYRVLGLTPGASAAEVKRAYRRLAKENHPDTAGEAAIPRFLAIQAAYEALVGSDGGAWGARGTDGFAPGAPWEADAERARATREAWQRRAGRRGAAGGEGAGRGAGGAAAGGGGSTGSTDGRRGGAAGGGAGADAGFGRSEAGGPAAPRSDARRRRGGSARRSADRPPDRATPGSTSYDYAEHEPFDPEWSGASWYGQSSGTYWTINPKEYADPRKHGPEYQARGRRRNGAGSAESAAAAGGFGGAGAAAGPGGAAEGADAEDAAADAAGSYERASGTAAESSAAGSRSTAGGRAYTSRMRPAPPPRDPRQAAAGETWAKPAGASRPPRPPYSPRPDPRPGDAGAARDAPWLTALPSPVRPGGRIGLALIGWPPIGLALALAVGQLSGCARTAATCTNEAGIGAWVAQAVVIAALLLVPALALIAATGTLAILAAAVPIVAVLTAFGGAYERQAAGNVLLVALGVAWLAGVVFAVSRRSRTLSP